MTEEIEGWLTPAQAACLRDAAGRLDAGRRIVEIGSFRGRSTVELARAAAAGVEIVAIDPHLGSDRGPQEIGARPDLGRADRDAFRANLARAGVAERVRLVERVSSEAHGEVDGAVDLLYVDGAHRYGPALADLRDWGARVPAGGWMLVHDSFSSIGVTLALLRAVIGRWRYDGRTGSLARFQRAPAGPLNALRALAQLPWFARNVVIKLLIVLRLRGGEWPY